MAGEPILRSEIETNIAKYLDRANDPVITDIVGTWFRMAHNKAQRMFNFSTMENIDSIAPLVEGNEFYTVAPTVKEPVYAEVIDTTNGFDILRKYKKVDMPTYGRYKLDGGYQQAVFAIEGRTYFLWPPTTQVNANMLFNVHCYMFYPTPAVDGHDWFTDYGSDFLMYQSLIESVDYISAPEGRVLAWQNRAGDAFSDLLAMDTQFKSSGLMALR